MSGLDLKSEMRYFSYFIEKKTAYSCACDEIHSSCGGEPRALLAAGQTILFELGDGASPATTLVHHPSTTSLHTTPGASPEQHNIRLDMVQQLFIVTCWAITVYFVIKMVPTKFRICTFHHKLSSCFNVASLHGHNTLFSFNWWKQNFALL